MTWFYNHQKIKELQAINPQGDQMKLTKEQIVDALKANVCKVTFTKINGEVRVMPCTLKEDVVPVYERKTPVKEATDKEKTTLSVWCTDKAAWRSFRVDSVTEISTVD